MMGQGSPLRAVFAAALVIGSVSAEPLDAGLFATGGESHAAPAAPSGVRSHAAAAPSERGHTGAATSERGHAGATTSERGHTGDATERVQGHAAAAVAEGVQGYAAASERDHRHVAVAEANRKVPPCAVSIDGVWKGQLGSVELLVTFGASQAGERVAFFDVPVQGVRGLASSPIERSEDRLTLQVPALGARYQATLHGTRIIGEWQHGPSSHVLILTRQ